MVNRESALLELSSVSIIHFCTKIDLEHKRITKKHSSCDPLRPLGGDRRGKGGNITMTP